MIDDRQNNMARC